MHYSEPGPEAWGEDVSVEVGAHTPKPLAMVSGDSTKAWTETARVNNREYTDYSSPHCRSKPTVSKTDGTESCEVESPGSSFADSSY